MRKDQLPPYVTDEMLREMRQQLRASQQDHEFFQEHHRQWLEEYPDRWVAVYDEQIVGVADTQREALELAQSQGATYHQIVIRYMRTQSLNIIMGGRYL